MTDQTRASFDRTLIEGPLSAAIWKIAWPTLVLHIISGFQGVIDHVMVGHFVGFTGNAAIGVSWQIFLVLLVFVSSLYGGMGVLVARFAGADEAYKVDRLLFQVLLASTALSLAVFAPLGYFLAPTLLDLVHAEPRVQVEALPYLRTLFVFSIGNMYFFLLGGGLRAAGDSRTPLRLGMLMSLLNVALNLVFIRGLGPIPGLGTHGAAIGTVIAGAIVSAYAFHLLFKGGLVIRLSTQLGFRPDWDILGAVVRFGLPTGLQGIAMNLGIVVMIRFVGSLEHSAEAQAAFAVGYTQLFSFVIWSSGALHAAAATMTGQSLGAGRVDRAVLAPLACTGLGLLVAIPLALIFLFIPRELLSIFDIEDPLVLTMGQQLLAFLSVSSPFVMAALSYTGALQGGGDTRSPFLISIVSQLALPIGLCIAAERSHGLEPGDIWFALLAGHVMRALLSVWRFQRGHWKKIDVKLGP